MDAASVTEAPAVHDLLKAWTRHLEEERRREQTLSLKYFLPGGKPSPPTPTVP
jgi:hypothetical protein